MKPKYRPGKIGSNGRKAREILAKSKPLTENQLEHLREERPLNPGKSKVGKGGKRANWDIDYQQGIQFDKETMPGIDETFTQDGVRKFPKHGR